MCELIARKSLQALLSGEYTYEANISVRSGEYCFETASLRVRSLSVNSPMRASLSAAIQRSSIGWLAWCDVLSVLALLAELVLVLVVGVAAGGSAIELPIEVEQIVVEFAR